MGYLNIEDFESGSSSTLALSGTSSISGTNPKTGSFALRVNPTTTSTGRCDIGSYPAAATGASTGSANISTTYRSFYFRVDTLPSTNNEEIWQALDATPAVKMTCRIDSTGKLSLYQSDGTTLIATGTTVLSTGSYYRISIVCGTGASAVYELYINGVLELSGTSSNIGSSGWGRDRLGKITNRNGKTVDFWYDDYVISDSALPPDGYVKTLFVNADGNYSTNFLDSAGGAASYTAVDETGANDGDTSYVKSTTANAVITFGLQSSSDVSIGSSDTINAVIAFALIKNSAAGNTARIRLRSGSTPTDLNGSTFTPSAASYGFWTTLGPRTTDSAGNAWTIANLDAAEVGVEQIADSANDTRVTQCGMKVFYTPAPSESASAQIGYISGFTANYPKIGTFTFTAPTGGYSWNESFTENSSKRPTIFVTSPTPNGPSGSRSLYINSIITTAVIGGSLSVDCYLTDAIKNGDVITATGISGWITDLDADITSNILITGTNNVTSFHNWPKPIANWLTVPYQVVNNSLPIEMYAYHRYGISGVEFKQGNTSLATHVLSGSNNAWSLSSVDGWPVLATNILASNYADGPRSFDYIATPMFGGTGSIRNTTYDGRSSGLQLYPNANSSITNTSYYVANYGNDTTGNGTSGNPYLTVSKAVQIAKGAVSTGNVANIKLFPGTYNYTADEGSIVNNGPWWNICNEENSSKSQIFINPASKQLGIRHLCYSGISICATGNGLSEGQTAIGSKALWINNCDIIGSGQQSVQLALKWADIAEWNEMYMTNSRVLNIPLWGATYFDIVRNSYLSGVQEQGFRDCRTVWGCELNDLAKYAGSAQHPDSWVQLDTLSDKNSLIGYTKLYDIEGQLFFFDVTQNNLGIVQTIGVQRNDTQYLVDFGKNSATETINHLFIEGLTIPNASLTYSSDYPSSPDESANFLIRNTVAKQFNLDVGFSGFDVTNDNSHGLVAIENSRYKINTATSGNSNFISASTGNYNSSLIDYNPEQGSALKYRLINSQSKYDIDKKIIVSGGSIGAYQGYVSTFIFSTLSRPY